MRPADLLGHQAEFARRYSAGPNPDTRMAQVLFAASWLSNRNAPNGELTRVIRLVDEDPDQVPAVIRDTPDAIGHFAQNGMPIKVEANMVDLVSWVADDLNEDEVVNIGMAPGPFGFVYLEKPLLIGGPEDEPVHIDWLLWGQTYGLAQRAVGFCGFNDDSRPDSLTAVWNKETVEAGYRTHRYHYTFMTAMADGDHLPKDNPTPIYSRPLLYDDTDADGSVAMSFQAWAGWNVKRWLYALWVVMGQEIADISEEHADRATKRRMARMRLPPAISVIKLRRPANKHEHQGESHVEWQHHWFVRGHPRWQAYGPGRSERKLIWINPHVKGNLDAPLRQTEKIYDVSR